MPDQDVGSAADALRGELGIALPAGGSAPTSGSETPATAPAVASTPEVAPAGSRPGATEPTVPDAVSREEFVQIMGHKDKAITELKGENTALLRRLEALEARPTTPPAVEAAPMLAAVPRTADDSLRADIAMLKANDRRRGLEAVLSPESGYKPGIVEKHWNAVERKMLDVPGLSAMEAMQLVAPTEDLTPAQSSSTPNPPAPRVEGGPSGTGGVEGSSARHEDTPNIPESDKLTQQATEAYNKGDLTAGKELMDKALEARGMELLGATG